ncbi:hypothetical protein [Streptococcus mitis]|jgi:hypothetical protein|uniref:hypothetical protein n=1 Tax=Streptococcus mitis TaxID=28037 RepID=UPI0021B61339|nr:hypothetical protein [Streptococcus mitis]
MRINILFKRINKLNYAINEDILREPLDETSEDIKIKNDFSYISDIEESRILVTVTTSIESKRGDREFRRLDIEIDVLLELLDYSDEYNEEDIIDRVHEKYEPLHKIIIDNITNSLTSLDDLPKI